MAVADAQILQKLKMLNPAQKQSVDDFISFLLSKEWTTAPESTAPVDALLQVSIWDEEAERAVREAQEVINWPLCLPTVEARPLLAILDILPDSPSL